MSKKEKKNVEASPEEMREAARQKWIKERQAEAVKANEPIKSVFRLTIAVDVVADTAEQAKESIKEMKGGERFVFGLKGVRKLEALFQTSEAFKEAMKAVERRK